MTGLRIGGESERPLSRELALREALMKARSGLVRKKVTVSRGGRTFQTTVWARPDLTVSDLTTRQYEGVRRVVDEAIDYAKDKYSPFARAAFDKYVAHRNSGLPHRQALARLRGSLQKEPAEAAKKGVGVPKDLDAAYEEKYKVMEAAEKEALAVFKKRGMKVRDISDRAADRLSENVGDELQGLMDKIDEGKPVSAKEWKAAKGRAQDRGVDAIMAAMGET